MNGPLEILRPATGRRFVAAMFDFDGTISLIRQGWQEVMAALELEVLGPLGHGLAGPALRALVEEDIGELTGRQTIAQMARLAERVLQFGGRPAAPLEYKAEYTRRLLSRIAARRTALAEGEVRPAALQLAGAAALLEELRRRGVKLYLTSGTDEAFVVEEARLLGVAGFFDGGIHGARDDETAEVKATVIARMIARNRLVGPGLLGVGDGFVEIVETRRVDGYCVGVASNEAAALGAQGAVAANVGCPGRAVGGQAQTLNDGVRLAGAIDPWKRQRLIRAGADMIVPDFADLAGLTAALFE